MDNFHDICFYFMHHMLLPGHSITHLVPPTPEEEIEDHGPCHLVVLSIDEFDVEHIYSQQIKAR